MSAFNDPHILQRVEDVDDIDAIFEPFLDEGVHRFSTLQQFADHLSRNGPSKDYRFSNAFGD
jgi:hypothetical protein